LHGGGRKEEMGVVARDVTSLYKYVSGEIPTVTNFKFLYYLEWVAELLLPYRSKERAFSVPWRERRYYFLAKLFFLGRLDIFFYRYILLLLISIDEMDI
jgi:hypothetical protein